MKIRQIELERIHVAVGAALSRRALEGQAEFRYDQWADGLVGTLRSYVWAQSVGEKHVSFKFSYAVPETWWDAFKAEHPRLCARLSPPRYRHVFCEKSVSVVAKAMFPDYHPPAALGRSRWYLEEREPSSRRWEEFP